VIAIDKFGERAYRQADPMSVHTLGAIGSPVTCAPRRKEAEPHANQC